MLDTVKINHVQHISFTQSRLTDAVSVILSELLSYEHPSNTRGRNLSPQKVKQDRKTWHNAHLNSGRFLLPERRRFYVEHDNTFSCIYSRYSSRRCAALSDAGRKNGG